MGTVRSVRLGRVDVQVWRRCVEQRQAKRENDDEMGGYGAT